MLLSERQRLVAEAGLLTLLAWMAATIAFNTTPRESNARVSPPQTAEAAQNAGADETNRNKQEHTAGMQSSLPPAVASMSALLKDPSVTLAPSPQVLPTGTVIRMGEGVCVLPEADGPEPCLNRSANGSSSHGPVP